MQDAISAWKNRPEEAYGRVLGEAFASSVGVEACEPLVIPIPSTPLALARRGFNPAAALARPLARRLGAAYVPTALRFKKFPASSRGLGRRARAERMRGVFTCREFVAGRDVVVVDDVMTTGATVREATAACLRAGATSVEVVVLARVPAT